MTSRRGPSHVRPRPPSSGRPAPTNRVKAPDRHRVRQHRGLEARRRRTPLALRTLLAISVVMLAGGVFVVASGGIGPVLGTLAGGFTSAFDRLVATPVPTRTDLPPTDSPVIAQPAQPATNQTTVNLAISVPIEVLGDPAAKVRVYLALEGLQPAPVVDVPVGTTSRLVVPFELTPGRNDVSATLFRGDVESEHSPIVTWFLDQEPPRITIERPKNNAAIDAHEVTVAGSTQAGTTVVARNVDNSTSITTVASSRDGSFELGLPLVPGSNIIEITGTDPAGNQGTATLTLFQGSKEMIVRLSASTYRISVSDHPASLQLTVFVADPAGTPLAGATAFFTLQIPGLAPISNELTTSIDGRASFTTPLVGTLAMGGGVGTVLVSHELYGQSTDRVDLQFVK